MPGPGRPMGGPVFTLTSFLHVTLAVLLGQLVSRAPSLSLPPLVFALVSKAFALAVGEDGGFPAKRRWTSPLLLALSILLLAALPSRVLLLGLGILFLYLTYPLLVRARERPPLDVLYHGSRYALLFLLGHEARPLGGPTWLGSAILFLFGVAGELLVGLEAGTRGTASLLGPRWSRLAVAILILLATMMGGLLLQEIVDVPLRLGVMSLPAPLLLAVPPALYLSLPVLRAPLNPGGWVRRRELILSLLLGGLALAPVWGRVDVTLDAPSEGYRMVVVMRTWVAGTNPWDVPWIIFGYRDDGNYYYLLLHKDGLLELSRVTGGTRETFLASARTSLSPFDRHEYRIDLLNGEIRVSIDGVEYLRHRAEWTAGLIKISNRLPGAPFWIGGVERVAVAPAGDGMR